VENVLTYSVLSFASSVNFFLSLLVLIMAYKYYKKINCLKLNSVRSFDELINII